MSRFKTMTISVVINYIILVAVPLLLTFLIIKTSSINVSQYLYIFNLINSGGLSLLIDGTQFFLFAIFLVLKFLLLLGYVAIFENRKITIGISILLLILSIISAGLQLFYSFAT